MTRALLMVALLGCGRINFDPVTEVACAAEICDGVDNDCDDLIDEVCACTPFDSTMPVYNVIDQPGFVWTGTGYLVVINEAPMTYRLAEVGSDGAFLARSTDPLPFYFANGWNLEWTGKHAALVSHDMSYQLFVDWFDAHAQSLGRSAPLAANSMAARAVWAGDRLIVAWTDRDDRHVELADISFAGDFVRWPPLVPALTGVVDSLVVTPTGCAIGVGVATDVSVLAFVAPTGDTMQVFVDYPPNQSVLLRFLVVRGPTGFIAIRPGAPTYLVTLDDDGRPRSAPVATPFGAISSPPDVVRIASGYQLFGHDDPGTLATVVVDVDGNVGAQVQLGSFPASVGGYPSAISTAGRVGVTHSFDAPGTVRVVQLCD